MKLPKLFVNELTNKMFQLYMKGYEHGKAGKDSISKEDFAQEFQRVWNNYK